MVGSPDLSRIYLSPFLFKLAELCSDAKISFSIFINSENKLNERPPKWNEVESNYWDEMKKFNEMRNQNSAISRIALHFFILISANISKIIWPYVGENTREPKRGRRQRRINHLEKFFPATNYTNLKNKQFRNFLEHFDDELDGWDETNDHHNIVMGSTGVTKDSIKGDVTIWQNFDPATLSITYYHEKKGSESTDLRAMYLEIEKLHLEIPKALVEIYDAPPNQYDHILDI